MSGAMFRRGLLAVLVSLGLAGAAVAQQAAPQAAKVQGFPTADARRHGADRGGAEERSEGYCEPVGAPTGATSCPATTVRWSNAARPISPPGTTATSW